MENRCSRDIICNCQDIGRGSIGGLVIDHLATSCVLRPLELSVAGTTLVPDKEP